MSTRGLPVAVAMRRHAIRGGFRSARFGEIQCKSDCQTAAMTSAVGMEKSKKALVAEQSVAVALAGTGGGLVGAGLATVQSAFTAIIGVVANRRQARINAWLERLIEAEADADQFAVNIEEGLRNHRDPVVEAVMSGARAAADVIDDAAIAHIALLTKEVLAGRVPRWFHRQALELLVNVDASEIGELRTLVQTAVSLAGDEAQSMLAIATPFNREQPAQIEYTRIIDDYREGNFIGPDTLRSAVQLFVLMRRAGLADVPSTPIVGGGNTGAVEFTVETAGRLLSILP